MGDHGGGGGRAAGRISAGQAVSVNAERRWLAWEDYDNDFLDTNYKRQTAEATFNEISSLQVYASNGHADINWALRTEQELIPGKYPFAAIQDLDAMFKRDSAVLQHNITVTRGFGEKTDWIKQLAVGDVVTDNGFISTAVKPIPETNTYRVVIQVPAKTRGLWLEPLTTHEGEYELLLDRGTSFRVTSRNMETEIPTLTVIGQRKR